MPAPLNPRQMLFVENYLIDLDGKAAAIRAGYRPVGAASRASSLLRMPTVAAALGAAMAARAARTGITRERVLDEYARIAFANMRRFADWGPDGARFVDGATLSDEETRAIAEIVDAAPSNKKSGVARVKLFDKLAALRSLGLILERIGGADGDAAPLDQPWSPKLRPPSRKRLTDRRRRFAEEFLVDFNAGAAAIRAGYTKRSGPFLAGKLTRDPAIAAIIAAGFATRRAAIRIDADRVLLEYARIAFADIARIADWGQTGLRLKRQRDVSAHDTAAIEAIGPAAASRGLRAGQMRLRLYDKIVALDALARHLGLLPHHRHAGRAPYWNTGARRTSAALGARLGTIAKP